MVIAYISNCLTRFLVLSITLFMEMTCARVRAVFKQDPYGASIIIYGRDDLRGFILPINVNVPTNVVREIVFLVNGLFIV